MQKRGLMQFMDGSIESLQITPSEKDPIGVLLLSAPMTPEIAALLKCDYIYKNGSDTQEGLERQDLGLKLRDVDVVIDDETLRPEMLWKFSIRRNLARYDVHFRARFYGVNLTLAGIMDRINKDTFELAIRSLQEEFNFGKEDAAGGTPVEMSGGEECLHCNNDVPKNEDGLHMLNGELVHCESSGTGRQTVLPSMNDMGTGTHAKKARKTRTPVEEPTEEEVGASVQ